MTVPVQTTGNEIATAPPRLLDARWALRRAILGVMILVLGVGSLAWLTHASIDQTLEAPAYESSR